ncbi:MAG: hypothetical protein JWN23_696 [Rhodocyclales bacterium]|nr:hypothetical protein [Rhodocyclales bacterium]
MRHRTPITNAMRFGATRAAVSSRAWLSIIVLNFLPTAEAILARLSARLTHLATRSGRPERALQLLGDLLANRNAGDPLHSGESLLSVGSMTCAEALPKVRKCMEIRPVLKNLPALTSSLRRVSSSADLLFVEVERRLVLPAAAAELRAALRHLIQVGLAFLLLCTRSAGRMLGVGIIKAGGHGEPFCLVSRAFRRSSNAHGFNRLAILLASAVPKPLRLPQTRANACSAGSEEFAGDGLYATVNSPDRYPRTSFLHGAPHWPRSPGRSSPFRRVVGDARCLFSFPFAIFVLPTRYRSLSCKF